MHDVMPQPQTGELRRRGHVARLYPSVQQLALLDGQGQAMRLLWNLIHDWWTWGGHGIARRPPPSELDRQIREARKNPLPGWEWLEQLPAQAGQQVLKDYLRAWGAFQRRLARPPKYKRRRAQMGVGVPQASALNVARLNHRLGRTLDSSGRTRSFPLDSFLARDLAGLPRPDHRRSADQRPAWLACLIPHRGTRRRGSR